MKPKNPLPLILVSACDKTTAESFISELIDNEVTGDGGGGEGARVWRLVNKYYSADVAVAACGDADAPPAADAHVIYLTPQECATEAAAAAASARAGAAGAAGARSGVRVAAARAVRVPAALEAWARGARYEPVPLLEAAPATPPGPFAEESGVARVRGALHAHPWRGLRRLDRAAPPPAEQDWESSSGSECDEAEDEAGAVERAEQFARALGALGDAAGAAGGAEERLERAEQLVAAFCRALGHDLDAC